MTNRLQTIIPAMFQPVDPIMAVDPAATPDNRIQRLTAATAISLALLLVGLIAVLMGMT
jgi:hypothetical protein